MPALVTAYTSVSTVPVVPGQDCADIDNVLVQDTGCAFIDGLSGNAYWIRATAVADTSTIPADAQITGFGFRVMCSQIPMSDEPDVKIVQARLRRVGVTIGVEIAPLHPAFPVESAGYIAFGGNGVLGEMYWTVAQAVAATSGVEILVQNTGSGTSYTEIDVIEPTIHWIPASEVPSPAPLDHGHRGVESRRYMH